MANGAAPQHVVDGDGQVAGDCKRACRANSPDLAYGPQDLVGVLAGELALGALGGVLLSFIGHL